jgi:hypothetical protein
MTDNTLLGRCVVAYEEAFNTFNINSSRRRVGMASVLEHLAAEIIVMHQREPQLSVHELARRLTLEAAGELAGWEVEE